MKIALVHDWLITYGGAERAVEQILAIYPEADVFSLIHFPWSNNSGFDLPCGVKTSFIQRFPFARTKYRSYLPFMPFAIEQFDLSDYDLVISSSHAVAKGVITAPHQLHLSYVYSPIRYAWDLQHQYLKETGLDKGLKGWLARWFLHKIRVWDVRTSNGVDAFASISHFINQRIWKVYRRESKVIYPPVATQDFEVVEKKEDFYLTASRMVPYKKMDLIVEAFSTLMPDKKLVVIGEGPDFNKIKAKAGPNVEMLGFQPFSVLKDHLQRAKAFVFASLEDFGIIVVEAQACGTPVIVFGAGGSLETVRNLSQPSPTGVFFKEQTSTSLRDGVEEFERKRELFKPEACRENAMRFSEEKFRHEFKSFVEDQMLNFLKVIPNQAA